MSDEQAIIECMIGVLASLAQATEVLGAEMVPTLSMVQPLLIALKKKHLKVREIDPKVTVDTKTAIATSIDSHFPDQDQRNLTLLVSRLDPRIKFLPSRGRNCCMRRGTHNHHLLLLFFQKVMVVISNATQLIKPKKETLLDYHEASSDSNSNGSSPLDEFSRYKLEDEIDNSANPLAWW